jgi:murein DD-endopeptidase MepM/ murein hydrolase activator NlpD
MNKNRRTYRVMIIPESNGKRTISFQISSAWVSFLISAIACFFIVSVMLMYKSVLIARQHQYSIALQNDNERLLKENNQLHMVHQKFVYLDSIATYLEQLSAVEQRGTKEAIIAGPAAKTKSMTAVETINDPRSDPASSNLPVDGWTTQTFTNDTTQEKGGHPGIDIAAPAGTNIKAPAPGTVFAVLQDVDYGTMVVLEHDGGFITRYGHCAKVMVSVGDRIVQGQIVAVVGNTGHSSAPHLHYEVIKNGKNVDPQQCTPLPGKIVKQRSDNG